MKYLVSFVLLFCGLSAFSQADTIFVLGAEFGATTEPTDSTFTVDIIHPTDQLGQAFTASKIQVGYRLIDVFGRLYRVKSVDATGIGSSTITVVELQDAAGPSGTGLVYRKPDNSDCIPEIQTGDIGISYALAARIANHNAVNGCGGGGQTVYFDNVAALAGASLSVGNVAITKGFSAPGDGGGATFYVQADSLDDYTTDNIAVVPVAAGFAVMDKSKGCNTKAFGIIGDGTTDQTLALQRVWNYCENELVFWDKDTSTYIVNRSKPRFKKLIFHPGVRIGTIPSGSIGLFNFENLSGATVEGNGVEMKMNRATTTQTAIQILSCDNSIFSGFNMTGSGKDGIYVGQAGVGDSCVNITIENMVIDSMNRQGISVVHSDGLTVRNSTMRNTFGQLPAAGIDLEANEGTQVINTVIDNCLFENNVDQGGVAVLRAKRAVISNCTFRGNLTACNVDLAGTAVNLFDIESIDASSDEITTTSPHGLSIGDYVRFRTLAGGVLPTPITSTTVTYRVFSTPTDSTFSISSNYKFGEIDITGSGTLPLQIRQYQIEENSDITFSNNILIGNNNNFYAEQAARLSFTGNSISGGFGGINLVNVANAIITNNQIDSTFGRAIYVTDRDAIITNNNIRYAAQEGIEIQGTENSVISNNVLVDCGRESDFAMFFKFMQNSLVSNNTVSEQDTSLGVSYGIVLDGAGNTRNNIVTGNIVNNNHPNNTRSITVGDVSNKVFLNQLNDGTLSNGNVSLTPWGENGSNIYYNSGNVGIGTDSPTTPLYIRGPAPSVTFFDETTNSTHFLIINNTEMRVQGADVLSLRGTTVTLAPGGTTKLTANASGLTASSSLNMGSNKITGLGTPTATTDAATKGYVETSRIPLSGTGSPVGSVTPVFVGQHYIDTTAPGSEVIWFAVGLANTNWVQLN
jgi:parallel beta-helix repeat protein